MHTYVCTTFEPRSKFNPFLAVIIDLSTDWANCSSPKHGRRFNFLHEIFYLRKDIRVVKNRPKIPPSANAIL